MYKIAIIEDDQAISQMYRFKFEAEGYEVAPANLSEGVAADLTLLKAGRVVMTIRNGKVITDDEGLTIPDVSRAGPYSNFK